MPVPRPGDDLVPDGWWRTTVVPWAAEQETVEPIRQAIAKVAGLGEAYRLMKADMTELVKARRVLEMRWGELMGPGKPGPQESSVMTEDSNKDQRRDFRELAWPEDRRVRVMDAIERARDGDHVSRRRLLRVARERLAEQRRAEQPPPATLVGQVEVRHGDFREVLNDLEGTVDAIITDPPYPQEYVPLFADLGAVAARLLAPNGVLVVMTGKMYLPAYLEHLSVSLRYRWVGAYLTPGPRSRVHERKVATGWKPLLIFHRHGATPTFLLDDVFTSPVADEHEHHHWGQSEAGMATIVERFTEPGALVLDPFLGGGTTAVVCRDLGRRFIGCDIDAAAVHASLERLA